MLNFERFGEEEFLVTVFLSNKEGKYFVIPQVAQKVFDWDSHLLLRKMNLSSVRDGWEYNIKKCTDENILAQLKMAGIIEKEDLMVELVSVHSLDVFLKNYSKTMSKFTRLYDLGGFCDWDC